MDISKNITICLNMIVKNESKIITRLFDTVLPIIDTFCICDTGSTDDTKDIITNYFKERKIEGKLFSHPFKDFGYNRTVALTKAKNMATYLLLLDADMKLVISPEFNKNTLEHDVYQIQQGGTMFKYSNTRLVKASLDVTCVGPTHEYYDLPDGCQQRPLNSLFIDDIGDGGCKENKFIRDIRLLEEGLKSEPNNGRYYFYLANTFFNIGKTEKARDMYIKRIEIGGWIEEVWYSYYRLGKCYDKLDEHDKAIQTWLEGYNFYPYRAENIYEIVKYYRIHSKHNLAYLFYKIGKKIPLPKDNVLFLHHDVYDFLFDYELSIIAYYLSPRPNVLSCYMKLFNTTTNLDTNHLLSNYKFYCKAITPSKSYDLSQLFPYSHKNFISSSPSIIPYENGYLLNLRYVDYKLEKNGDYTYADDYHVQTRNVRIQLDNNYQLVERTEFPDYFIEECRIRGLEDIKIIQHDKKIHFISTCQNQADGKLGMCGGLYHKDKLEQIRYPSPTNAECEKNWALFSHQNKLKFIYKWHPLTIGEISGEKVEITEKRPAPPILKMLRGSSNGYLYQKEYWFVCHIVEHSKPRQYYHCVVILDSETLAYKAHSRFFTFEGEKIEFCLGIIVKEDNIIMTHSCWDRTSQLRVYNKKQLLKDIFQYNI